MDPPKYPASSVTPTQAGLFRHGRSMSNDGPGGASRSRDGLQAPFRDGREGRSMSNANAVTFGPRGSSLAQGPPPGSFSSDLKTTSFPRTVTPRAEQGSFFPEYRARDKEKSSEERQTELREKINKETKIKVGSENLLEALVSKNNKQTREQRSRVEAELGLSNRKIHEFRSELEEEIQRSQRPKTPPRNRLSGLFQGSPAAPLHADRDSIQGDALAAEEESESPTYTLSNILQALECEGMQPDYYVERANKLVNLLKKYSSLKFDLAWPVFGLRIQTMLLSQSREVVAAGYRVTRHAIADRRSLQTIRRLNTDEMVTLSLVKESKANIEREQALKFVRAFLDVKGGIHEVSNGVLRTIVSIAEYHEDRLRNLSILTLLELLIRSPSTVVNAGGMAPLTESLLEGSYQGSESLASAIIHLFDKPNDRAYLSSSHELDAAFTIFTDPMAVHISEEKLKSSARLITALLHSWCGLFIVSNDNFAAIRGLLMSLAYPSLIARDLILDIIFAVLQIQAPSWASSFLAGRRLTTYGRVANLTKNFQAASTIQMSEEEDDNRVCLTEHYTALLLVILFQCGLQKALSDLIQEEEESALRRKAALLLGEVLNMANSLLPHAFSARLQVMPQLLETVSLGQAGTAIPQINMIYQMDSVSRTLHRSQATATTASGMAQQITQKPSGAFPSVDNTNKPGIDIDMDEIRFRAAIVDTQILNHTKYIKWNWDLIEEIVNGPLRNPKLLNEAISGTKWLKRLLGFYRPFKYRFSDAPNTKSNHRYVRVGVSLVKSLLQSSEGRAYLLMSKLVRQLAECLAQIDPKSGFTSSTPLFAQFRVSTTLVGGYFALLGALSSDPNGLPIMERWSLMNICYNLIGLRDREDVVLLFLTNMDFTLDSHLRVMLSKSLTTGSKAIRIFSTKILRKYVTLPSSTTQPQHGVCEWAIRLLVTQLYDPDVDVSEVAVRILEESCNQKSRLEYIVRCRPQLDHLNEIGAPLMLRFLSISAGYQYLDRLDYISQEMDDWFLGRNYTYVTLVEASLSHALSATSNSSSRSNIDEPMGPGHIGALPAHFYRELTHTQEGCDLLRDSGHFDYFATTIAEMWSEQQDAEALVKLKGCLWAVGNIGSVELGSSFLEETDVVQWIVKIAEKSEVVTLRGTAFFVLGLISRSLHGMEILSDYGWSAATDKHGRSTGYCIPPSLGSFFSVKLPPKLDDAALRGLMAKDLRPRPITDDDPDHARILDFVVSAGNTVLTKKAITDLSGIKARCPEAFFSVELYRKVRDILGAHSFRLPVRRFILDLFDRSVMRDIVLEEEESENESIRTQRPAGARPRMPLVA
ncbi:MAG: hypothetical protein Q9174_003536 [Haloplaca sp. 1 TL-2023]